MKLRKILAAVMIVIMVVTLAGCNYVDRPNGAGNHTSDLSSKLAGLLEKTDYEYEKPPVKEPEDENKDDQPDEPIDEPDDPIDQPDEPIVEPDPILTPFTSTYDPTTLLEKIDSLIAKVQAHHGVATSATGVSDKLLSGRTVKILVPDDFPIADEDEAVKALSAQYNCSIIVKRMGLGAEYTANCRRAALLGEKADLMYVDNSNWGDVHQFTQALENYIDLNLGDELNTFTSSYTEKFYVPDAFDNTLHHLYVAAGMGAPYVLAYNKESIKPATLAESSYVNEDGETVTLRAINVTDPVEMYNNRTWGVKALTALLQASTTTTNVGIASELGALEGLDIWYGMEDAAGMVIDATSTKATFGMDAGVNLGIDVIQDWYWNTTDATGTNYVGDFVDPAEWDAEAGTVFSKLFNAYEGSDPTKSYSFVACEVSDLVNVIAAADKAGAQWDFVAYPYGETHEKNYRSLSEIEFADMVTADEEGDPNDPTFVKQVHTPVAGWVGGFAVLKNCENPGVALRIGEEYTKIWKKAYEAPALSQMNETQLERYEDMKENIGVSFVRGWVEKAANVYTAYPDITRYFHDNQMNDVSYATLIANGFDPEAYIKDRGCVIALERFTGKADMVVAPMYYKDAENGLYSPLLQEKWSDWAEGTPSDVSEVAQDTVSIMRILNASLLPSTILFNW